MFVENSGKMEIDSLFSAVVEPDVVTVKFLLKHVNEVDGSRKTPLHHAVMKPYESVIKLLLEHGENVNVFDDSRQTPLHHAVLEPHVDNVKLLLEHGADVNAVNFDRKTPLHLVVLKYNVGIVKLLLEHGARVNALDNMNTTPLCHVVLTPFANILKIFLEHGAFIHEVHEFDDFQNKPYHPTSVKKIVDRLKLLWKRGTDVDLLDRIRKSSLFLAVRIPKADIIKLLLEHKDHVHYLNGQTPLKSLISEPHVFIVKRLLELGANVNYLEGNLRTPLHNFVLESHAGVVKLLLEHGANLNALDYLNKTPLHYAVLKPRVDMVKLLLEHGAILNVVDNSRLTLLHHAILKPHAEIVRLLLEYGANVNSLDFAYRTPLHYAALIQNLDIVKLLLDHGANVNALDVFRQTPLHYFLIEDKPNSSVLHTLVKYGANVNAVDKWGNHVFSAAVHHLVNPYQTVKLFLENGAIPDFDYETIILVDISLSKRGNLANLLIQYIILRLSVIHEMFEILDQFESFLFVHFSEDSENFEYFLNIAHSCFNEIKNMKNDFVCEKTLFLFVSKNYLRKTTYDQSIVLYDVDEFLLLLTNSKYFECRDIIYAAIKRSAAVDRLCELEICYQAPGSNMLTLNYYCIRNVTKYMLRDDVINLCIVFYDGFNVHHSLSSNTSKRSAEEIEENVYKKTRC